MDLKVDQNLSSVFNLPATDGCEVISILCFLLRWVARLVVLPPLLTMRVSHNLHFPPSTC